MGVFIGIGFALTITLTLAFIGSVLQHRVSSGRREASRCEASVSRIFEVLDISIPLQILIGFIQVSSGMSTTFAELLPPFYHDLRQVFSVLALDLVAIVDFGCVGVVLKVCFSCR